MLEQDFSMGEWERIKRRRKIKRQGKKPKSHVLDQYRPELLRRATLPQWSSRDLAEWLDVSQGLKVSHTTIWRYLKRQPVFINSAALRSAPNVIKG